MGVMSSVTWQWKLLLTYGRSETLRTMPYCLRNCSILQAAQGFCRCAVDRIEDAVLFLKLGNLVVDIFQRIECELSVLNKRFSVVQLLQLVQRRDAERCGHRL